MSAHARCLPFVRGRLVASLDRMLPLNQLIHSQNSYHQIKSILLANLPWGESLICWVFFFGGSECKKQNSNLFQNRKNCCNRGNIILRQIIQRKQSRLRAVPHFPGFRFPGMGKERRDCRQHINKWNPRCPHNAKFPLVEIDTPVNQIWYVVIML
jgi:hypothetical protein